MDLFPDIECGAEFSPCRTWRYALWRTWNDSKRPLAVIGLNPSTADETKNDPTITRCIKLAQRLETGGLVMLNLFGFRATDPRVMFAAQDPVGAENDRVIVERCREAAIVVAAWGVHGTYRRRDAAVCALIAAERRLELHCLGRTKDGHPRHPLYVRSDKQLERWTMPLEHGSLETAKGIA